MDHQPFKNLFIAVRFPWKAKAAMQLLEDSLRDREGKALGNLAQMIDRIGFERKTCNFGLKMTFIPEKKVELRECRTCFLH